MGPRSGVDWSRVVVWWGDERFVAPDSEDRNAREARELFLDRLPFDPAKVHEMPSTAVAGSVDEAAAAYSAELREHGAGAFEVLMLGVGPDGHVASLFPGSPQLDVDDEVAVGVTGSPKPPPERVSLTFGALNRSRCVWFLVNGEGKAGAVAQALAPGTDVHDIPSTSDAGSADDAAAAYSAELREHGAGLFEVLMLGLGPDGHVASLFPGHPQLDADDQVAVGITDSPKPPPERVTLTLAALNRSRCVWFLVNGEDKADAVAQALAAGTDLHDIPAAGVSGEAETIWFLDRGSASQL